MFEFVSAHNSGVLPVQNIVQDSVVPADYLTPMATGSDPGPYPPPKRLALLQDDFLPTDYLTPMVSGSDPGPYPPPKR